MGRQYRDRAFTRFDPAALCDAVHRATLAHRLLGGGAPALRVRNRTGVRLAVDAGDYGCAVYAQGTLHPEALTVVLVPLCDAQVFANGRPLPAHAMQVYAEGAAIDLVTPQAAGWRTVTVAREVLQAHAAARLGRTLVLPEAGSVQHAPDPAVTRQLTEQIEAGLRLAAHPVEDPLALARADVGVLDALTEALAQSPSTPEPRGARTRRRIMEVVESVARLGVQSAEVDATDLSQRCAASERLVEHAMRQGVGMPPKRWLTLARLNRVYGELADPANARSVTDTALHWGFNHLGRFASNYRSVFGESPSDTVARVRGDPRPRLTAVVPRPAVLAAVPAEPGRRLA